MLRSCMALATTISWGGQQGAGGRRGAGPSHFGSGGSDLTLPLACGSVDLRPLTSDLRPPASRDLCPTVLRRSSDGAPARSIASSSAMDSTNMPSSTMRCSSRFSSPLETAHDHFRSTCSRRERPRQCRCKFVTAVCWRGDSAGGPPASVTIPISSPTARGRGHHGVPPEKLWCEGVMLGTTVSLSYRVTAPPLVCIRPPAEAQKELKVVGRNLRYHPKHWHPILQ